MSGADVGSFLRADAMSPAEINSKTDLVLFPRQGSQIEIAERLQPQVVPCWIGNNRCAECRTCVGELTDVCTVLALRTLQYAPNQTQSPNLPSVLVSDTGVGL